MVRCTSMQSWADLTEINDVELVGSLRHFTQLQSLCLLVYPKSEMFNSWEFISTFLSIASPHSNLKALSIYLSYWTISSSTDIVDLANECGFVLRNAEALEPILDNSLKGLLTLNLELFLPWPPEFHDKSDHIRTQLSQSAVEEAVRKKLPKISEKASVTVSRVQHYFR